jgi:TonB family protein
MARTIALVSLAWAVLGCGGAPPAARAAEEPVADDPGDGTISFEPDVVRCARDRVAAPGRPSGECTGASTYVAVHQRLHARLPELASSCDGGGDVVVRFVLNAEGGVENAEVVTSSSDADSTAGALALVRSTQLCPPSDGRRTVITYPLQLR